MMKSLAGWALTFAAASAGLAVAQDVAFSVASDDKVLVQKLEGASVVRSLQDDEETQTAQDYLAAARAEYKRLLTALYSEGYYGGRISVKVDGQEAAAIPLLDGPNRVSRVAIAVEPGHRFTFGKLGLGPTPDKTQLPATFARGQIARSGAVRDAAGAAVDAWRAQGHAKAEPAGQQIAANHLSNQLDVSIAISPGPRLRFGPLMVDGKSDVRPERIRAIAGLTEGDIYDPEKLSLAQDRLRRTGAFRSVALVDADAYTPDLTLPIEAKIEDMKPRRIGAGLEYSNVNGITASAYWLHRNFLGGAERFRVEGEISGIGQDATDPDYTLGLEFSRPATIGPENTLYSTLSFAQLDEPNFFLREAEAEIGMHRIVNETFTISAGLGALSSFSRDELGERRYTLVTLPLKSTLDRRDDPVNAKNGYYLAAELTPFYGFNEAGRGMRMTLDARGYRSFGTDERFTLAGRAQMGALGWAEARDVPSDFLFFSGGGGTVRGQAYQSLGVERANGTKIGGRAFLGVQVEARVKVREKISVVGFYDWGHISAESTPGTDGASHAGAGIGVRYDTRLGPIRLDLATPASGDKAGEDLQIYIGIGQAF